VIKLRLQYPWEEDIYGLMHEEPDVFTGKECDVVTIDFKKRNWREKM